MKILIVDDSGDDRKLLRYVVEKNGHESIEAEDGLEGLRMAKIHVPDLIISDALMPVMDGFQFLKAVKGDERLRSIPFMFYSATYKADKDTDLAIALGAEAYILKPKEPTDLWNEVEIILQGQKNEKVITRELITEEEEYLKRYSQVVAAKLEEKVRKLEETLAERKRAEEQIRYQAALLANVNDAIVASDENYKLTAWNVAAESLYGWKAEEVLGRSVLEIVQTDYQSGGKDEMLRDIAIAERWRGEVTQARKDGTRIPVEVSSIVLHDESGRVIGYVSVNRDITERRRAEREHLAHLKFLESLDQINRAMQGRNDLEQMMGNVLDIVLSIFHCDRAWLAYPCDPEAASWGMQIERNRPEYPGAPALGAVAPVAPDTVQVIKTLRASGGPVQFGPGSEYPLPIRNAELYRVQSMIAMVICPKVGKPYMFGLHQCSSPRVWTTEEERLFQEVGRRLADGLTSLLAYHDLQESENRYRRITEGLTDYQYSVRVQNGRSVETTQSPACATVTGYTVEEFAADPYLWFRMVVPEDRELVRERVQQILAGKEIPPIEHRICRKDGETRWVSDTAILFKDASGQLLSYDGVIKDITERKRAERALEESEAKTRSILDNIGIGVSLISPKMEILELNHRMRKWFPAVDPGQHPLCYRALYDPPREAACDDCPTCKTLQDGLVHEATIQKTPQKGVVRNYRIVSSPLFNTSGEVTAAIEMVDDITERLSLESQFRQAQKMESVGRLAGGVAHDFNNMLGVIIGRTELAMDQVDPAQPFFADLQEIWKAAERSANLTRQLLAFARKQTIAPKVLDLNETVESILKMLRHLIGEDINLAWLPGKNLWPVNVDPSQIDQILANLCVNARDAIAGVGKVTIETETTAFDEAYNAMYSECVPGEYVLLAVSDDGCGMNKEIRDKLFEPFFTTKEMGKGTGLGLATVYGIVKQNNGFINVYSEPGQGTTFKIYLPRHKGETEQMQKEGSAEPARGHETILLVEDESAMLNLIMMMLQRLGYTVLAASTPGQAIRQAETHAGEIHLLMTDVVMPEMNGRDLAKNLLSLYPHLKRLFMSGYTANVIAHHGMLDEGVNYIQKPFSRQVLAAKVREALDSK